MISKRYKNWLMTLTFWMLEKQKDMSCVLSKICWNTCDGFSAMRGSWHKWFNKVLVLRLLYWSRCNLFPRRTLCLDWCPSLEWHLPCFSLDNFDTTNVMLEHIRRRNQKESSCIACMSCLVFWKRKPQDVRNLITSIGASNMLIVGNSSSIPQGKHAMGAWYKKGRKMGCL